MKYILKHLLQIGILSLIVVLQPFDGFAQTTPTAPKTTSPQAIKDRDGQRDFDFNIGTWKTQIKRLDHPLTGSDKWIEWNGTVVVSKVWDGRANLEELKIDGPSGGHIEGLTLRLYNPQSREWSLNWANSSDGVLDKPLVGEFKDGRGVFINQGQFSGRTILVRHTYSNITQDSHHFEQAFSVDGGATWEANWIANLTRVKK
jgi:hypothetical protein